MSDLKDQLIKLGSEEPQLRGHIRTILDGLEKSARSGSFWIIAEDERGLYAHGPFESKDKANEHMKPLSPEVKEWYIVDERGNLDSQARRLIEDAKKDREVRKGRPVSAKEN